MSFRIGDRYVGRGHPCFIIAEAGVNHNGDLGMAKALIDAAAESGADAVKFQTFRADALATASAPKAEYQKRLTDPEETQLEMLRKLELSADQHRELWEHSAKRGILFLSTPFEAESADLLERLGVVAFKLPSGELTNLPFLRHVARKGRPLILSTGMANLAEVETALEAVRGSDVAVLHCVSRYPAPAAEANLRAMHTLEAAFRVPVGYSDHTVGIEVALAAAALGASVLEKHFTLDRTLPGPDHAASLEPGELKALVSGIRLVEAALGDGRKVPSEGERATAAVARKSLVAARDLAAGAEIQDSDLATRRPGTGLPPAMATYLVGRRTRLAIRAGTVLTLEMLQ